MGVGSLTVTNVPLWGGDVDNGGGRVGMGWGAYGKSLYLPLNFAVNL